MYDTFEEWFDNFVEYTQRLDYSGPIDKDAFVEEYEAEKDPEEIANSFVEEMTN